MLLFTEVFEITKDWEKRKGPSEGAKHTKQAVAGSGAADEKARKSVPLTTTTRKTTPTKANNL